MTTNERPAIINERYELGRRVGTREVGREVQRFPHSRSLLAPRAGGDSGSLLGEDSRGLQTDALGRSGDDADAILQAKVHGRPTITP